MNVLYSGSSGKASVERCIFNVRAFVTSRFSPVPLFVTLWTVAHQAPLSMGFPRQEYWSGLSFPPPGDLPDPGIKPTFSALAGSVFTTEPPRKLKF